MGTVLLVRWVQILVSPNLQQEVLNLLAEKFAGTGIFITANSSLATALDDHVRQLIFHGGVLDMNGPEVVGQAYGDWAEVDVSDLLAHYAGAAGDGPVVEALASLGAHEAAHTILPIGHSIEATNLMSPGHRIHETIAADGGQSLEFTALQRDLLAGRVEVPADAALAQVEMEFHHGLALDRDEAAILAENVDAEGEIDVSDLPDTLVELLGPMLG